jgi:DNA-binding NarL/FixJ family response regulator
LDFTDRLDQLEPKRRMMASWVVSSGMRLSFVIAMKSHLGIMAMVCTIVQRKAIKGIATTEEEAFLRLRQNRPGLLICSDQLVEGDGFSLCRRSLQVVPDLRVLMVLTGDGTEAARALESGAMAVVCEEDFLQPELEVMQSMLAAANQKSYVSSRARARLRAPEAVLLLKGLSDVAIADALGISIYTVKDYGKSIRAKYNVKTRVQLISALLGRALHKGR